MNATISLHVWVFMSGSWGGQRRVLYYLNPPNHLVVSSAPNTLFKISNFVVIAESLLTWRQRLGLHWSFTSQCGATYFKDASHLKLYHGHFPKRLNVFFCHCFSICLQHCSVCSLSFHYFHSTVQISVFCWQPSPTFSGTDLPLVTVTQLGENMQWTLSNLLIAFPSKTLSIHSNFIQRLKTLH